MIYYALRNKATGNLVPRYDGGHTYHRRADLVSKLKRYESTWPGKYEIVETNSLEWAVSV